MQWVEKGIWRVNEDRELLYFARSLVRKKNKEIELLLEARFVTDTQPGLFVKGKEAVERTSFWNQEREGMVQSLGGSEKRDGREPGRGIHLGQEERQIALLPSPECGN